MDRLYKEGFPVPKVILYEEDKSFLGGPFLMMDYIEHKRFYTKVINATPSHQENLMKRFAESLISETDYPDTAIILIPGYFYKWPMKNLVTYINKIAKNKGEKVDAKPFL